MKDTLKFALLSNVPYEGFKLWNQMVNVVLMHRHQMRMTVWESE